MAALMRDDIGVGRRSVEVCKDERDFIIRKLCHVSSSLLRLAPVHVEKSVFAHEVHELAGFLRKIVIKPASCLENFIRRADGLRISVGEVHILIVTTQPVKLQVLTAALLQFLRIGNKVIADLSAELLKVASSPAVAHHAAITEGEVIPVSEGLSLLRAVLYQFIIEIIEFLCVG